MRLLSENGLQEVGAPARRRSYIAVRTIPGLRCPHCRGPMTTTITQADRRLGRLTTRTAQLGLCLRCVVTALVTAKAGMWDRNPKAPVTCLAAIRYRRTRMIQRIQKRVAVCPNCGGGHDGTHCVCRRARA